MTVPKIILHLYRCLSVLAEKVTQTTAVDDKRIRKELQVDEMLLLEPSHLPVRKFRIVMPDCSTLV